MNTSKDGLPILVKAAANTIAYREYFGAHLSQFPLTRKSDFRFRPADFLSSRHSQSERASLLCSLEKLLSGPKIPDFRVNSGGFIFERSSGTTGPYMWYPRTRSEMCTMSLISSKTRKRFNPYFSANVFLDLTSSPELFSPTSNVGAEKAIIHFSSLLKTGKYRHVYGTLSLLRMVGIRTAQESSSSSIDCIEIGGAFPDSENVSQLRTLYGTQVLSQFACREVWNVGYDDRMRNSYAISDETIVELIDEKGCAIEVEGQIGAIAVTSTIFETFPIIRFLTGDFGHWASEGRTRSLTLQDERLQSSILLSNGVRTSGIRVMKNLIGRVYTPQSKRVLGQWRVRRNGLMLTFYIEAIDWECRRFISHEFNSYGGLEGLNHQFRLWSGWNGREKEILYIDETVDFSISL